MGHSFEQPVGQEEGSRLFKEMRERLANPDYVPEPEKVAEVEAATEKTPPQLAKKVEKFVTSVAPRNKSSAGKGWLTDWQEKQEAENERRLGTETEAIIASFKSQERVADEKQVQNEQIGHEHGNN